MFAEPICRSCSCHTGTGISRTYVRRFGEDKAATFKALRAEFGEPDLTPLIKAYDHALR